MIRTDSQLLSAYTERGEQGAFAELVARHITWVAAAARRRLSDSALADDATQATFILLAQKARSLRGETVLSAWLFQTLRYTCLATARAERRRRQRETQAAQLMQASQNDRDNEHLWNELAGQLDEVVAKLGGVDRRAVLLRFYENKSFVEVGQMLGMSEDAARKRVVRAVEKLGMMFRRRSVTVSATALAAVMATHVAPSSASAASVATVAAAATSAAPSAVAKSAGAMLAWAHAKAAAILVTASVAAVAAGGAAAVAVASKSPPKPAATTTTTTAPAQTMVMSGVVTITNTVTTPAPESKSFVAGRVLTPDEKPFAGATITVNRWNFYGSMSALKTATTAADGSFRIPLPTTDSISSALVDAPPWAYGVAYVNDDPAQEVVLKPACDVEVTLLLPEGSPAAGVEVAPERCNGGNVLLQDFWSVEFPEEVKKQIAQRTDANGKCRFTRMPPNTQMNLDVRDERFAKLAYADQITIGPGPHSVGAALKLKPAGQLSGRLGYPDGKPVAGVNVAAQAVGENAGGWGAGVTDANGVYHITRLAPARYQVIVSLDKRMDERATVPSDWTAAARTDVALAAGQSLDQVDISLVRGTIVSGRVTAADTGAPLPDIDIGLSGPARPQEGGAILNARTGADGSYSLRVPAGKQTVYICGQPPEGYLRPRKNEIEVTTSEGKDATANFVLPRAKGKAVAGVVTRADGSPAAGAWVSAELLDSENPIGDSMGVRADTQGRFAFKSVTPKSKLRATLGRMKSVEPVVVSGGETNVALAVEKTLPIQLKGRIVDDTGKPIPSAQVSLTITTGRFGIGSPNHGVDADGNFAFDDLRLGDKYTLSAQAPHFGRKTADVTLVRGKQTIEQPPIVLARADSMISGTVVDQSGKPLPNLKLCIGGAQTVPREGTTDAQGRFEFGDIVAGDQIDVNYYRDGNYLAGGQVEGGSVDVQIVAKPPRVPPPAR
jgi:RNA polymerase sigma factor (sigma-70 family)